MDMAVDGDELGVHYTVQIDCLSDHTGVLV